MKQTAVEFLMEELKKNDCIGVPSKFWNKYEELVEYAKNKEKQQIIDAYKDGVNGTKLAEQYYNETFKK